MQSHHVEDASKKLQSVSYSTLNIRNNKDFVVVLTSRDVSAAMKRKTTSPSTVYSTTINSKWAYWQDQNKTYNHHISPGGFANTCPPGHTEWPGILFKFDMKPSQFNTIVSQSELVQRIIREELVIETSAMDRIGSNSASPDDHRFFDGKRMKFGSWSVHLQMQRSLNIGPIRDNSRPYHTLFPVLLGKEIQSYMDIYKQNEPTKPSTDTESEFKQRLVAVFTTMNTMRLNVFEPLVAMEHSLEHNWVNGMLRAFRITFASQAGEDYFGLWFLEVVIADVKTLFRESKESKAIKTNRTNKLRNSGLENPVNVDKSLLFAVVRFLWSIVLTPGDDRHGRMGELVFDKNEPRRIAAALCILQLGCGSRARGVIAVNTIRQFEHENANTLFPFAARNVIVVGNLTKKASVARIRASTHSQNYSTIDEITKPILFDFFDPMQMFPGVRQLDVISPHITLDGNCELIRTHQTSVFIDMLAAVRAVVLAGMSSGYVESIPTRHTQPLKHVTSEQQTKRNPEILKITLAWEASMVRVLKEADKQYKFDVFVGGKGTHQLRKLYVAFSYVAYTDQSMKEVAWAQRVLGHADPMTSLLYTSMKIIHTQEPDQHTPKVHTIEFNAIVYDDKGTPQATTVGLRKLPRKRRGDANDNTQQIKRAESVIVMLRRAGVPITVVNMRKLGVSTNPIVYKAAIESVATRVS